LSAPGSGAVAAPQDAPSAGILVKKHPQLRSAAPGAPATCLADPLVDGDVPVVVGHARDDGRAERVHATAVGLLGDELVAIARARGLDVSKGVVYGTRMIVTWVDPSLKRIRAKLLSERGTRPREVLVTLHRCTIQRGAFAQERTQQGLTLKRVGLFLDKDVFAHGQVYVGTSRRGDPDKLLVYGNLDANGERWVAHPVYREVLPKYACVVACKVQDSIARSLEGAARMAFNGEAIERPPNNCPSNVSKSTSETGNRRLSALHLVSGGKR
jgi:hypothetical protein